MINTSNFFYEEKVKSVINIEQRSPFIDKPHIPLNLEKNHKRNNRYVDKSMEKEIRTHSLSRPKNPKTPAKSSHNSRPTMYSVEKSKEKPKDKIFEKLDNIFEKNQNYISKNKNNYEETLKKLGLITQNENKNAKVFSPSIRVKDCDNSFRLTNLHKKNTFENQLVAGLKNKILENYEQSLEKIDHLYKKNDMAIRDYIMIKDSLNFSYLVIFCSFFIKNKKINF